MTISNSPTRSIGCLVANLTKGSTYGKQMQCWSSRHSFQEPTRDGGSYNTNGAQVLYSQAPLLSLRQRSIILGDEARDPATTRNSQARV